MTAPETGIAQADGIRVRPEPPYPGFPQQLLLCRSGPIAGAAQSEVSDDRLTTA